VAGHLSGTPEAKTTSTGILTSFSGNHFHVNGIDPVDGQGISFLPGNNFIIASGAGQITGIGPRDISVDATTAGEVNLDAAGNVTLTLTLSRPQQSGDRVHIDWADGLTDSFTLAPHQSVIVVTHHYSNIFGLLRPDSHGDQTAPIFVTVTLTNPDHIDIDPSNVPGTTANVTQVNFGLIENAIGFPPLDVQLFGTTEKPLPPPDLGVGTVQTVVLPVLNQLVLALQEPVFSTTVRATNTLGIPFLRSVLPNGMPDGPDEELPGSVLKNPDSLAEYFRNRPDGHYQILLRPSKDSPTERLVLDIYVRQGQVIDFADILEDQTGEPAENEALPPGDSDEQGRLDVRPSDPGGTVGVGIRVTAGAMPLVGAALAVESLRLRWRDVEAESRRSAHRPLTKAGRLYSRIRQRAAALLDPASDQLPGNGLS
jgi:hypothetical protein